MAYRDGHDRECRLPPHTNGRGAAGAPVGRGGKDAAALSLHLVVQALVLPGCGGPDGDDAEWRWWGRPVLWRYLPWRHWPQPTTTTPSSRDGEGVCRLFPTRMHHTARRVPRRTRPSCHGIPVHPGATTTPTLLLPLFFGSCVTASLGFYCYPFGYDVATPHDLFFPRPASPSLVGGQEVDGAWWGPERSLAGHPSLSCGYHVPTRYLHAPPSSFQWRRVS